MAISHKDILTAFIKRCWQLVFKRPASEEAVCQMRRFFLFGLGMMAARITSIATQILLGRELGPVLYGKITIIILLSSYFSMPMINGWGLAFIKIASSGTDRAKKLEALKSFMIVALLFTLITSFGLTILRVPLAKWLEIDNRMMDLTIVMTLLYAWWIFSKQVAQGFNDWHTYIAVENSWALIVLLGAIVAIFMFQADLVTISTVFFTGYFLAGFGVSKSALEALFQKINFHYVRSITSHGWILLVNGLVGVATFSIDRILINRSLGAGEVGIYQAHFLATYGVISAIITIILTYVFPIFCQDKNNYIHSMLNQLTKIQYPVTIVLSALTGVTILWLYSYPVSVTLFSCLCLFNALQFHMQLKVWYISSKGANASKGVLLSQLIFLVVNVSILMALVRDLGIVAGGISLVGGSLASLLCLAKTERTQLHERII